MPVFADPLMLLAASVVFGLVVGVLSGLLGIGGGTLMIPAFRLLFGMSPTMCTATSLFAIVPTSFSGAVRHVRNGTCLLSVALAAGLSGACTSPLGALLAQRSPGWLIMLTAALIIGYTALNMLRKAAKMPKKVQSRSVEASKEPQTIDASRAFQTSEAGESPKGAGAAKESSASEGAENAKVRDASKGFSATRKQLAIAVGIGMVAGVASGFAGIGGGFLMVPMFLSVLGLSMKQASGTSLAAIIVLATPGVIAQMMMGNVNYFAGIAVVCGTIPGAYVGAWLTKYVPDRALRFAFGAFLLFGAVMLVLNELMLAA